MYLYYSFTVLCGKSLLYILVGTKLQSLPDSILYLHVSVLCLLFFLNFAVITDLMLWILKNFDLTTPVMPPLFFFIFLVFVMTCSASFSFCHLFYTCSGLCIPIWSDSFSHTVDSSCHMLNTFLAHVYSCSIYNCYLFLFCLWYCSFCPCFFMVSNSFVSLLPLLTLSGPFACWLFCLRITFAHWWFHSSFWLQLALQLSLSSYCHHLCCL